MRILPQIAILWGLVVIVLYTVATLYKYQHKYRQAKRYRWYSRHLFFSVLYLVLFIAGLYIGASGISLIINP